MRTIVNIPDKAIEELAQICKGKKISRAEAIRRAVSDFIDRQTGGDADFTEKAFGIWKDKKVDGLCYEDDIRSEWERNS